MIFETLHESGTRVMAYGEDVKLSCGDVVGLYPTIGDLKRIMMEREEG
jgi:hypothetical protein